MVSHVAAFGFAPQRTARRSEQPATLDRDTIKTEIDESLKKWRSIAIVRAGEQFLVCGQEPRALTPRLRLPRPAG